jgi:predicted transcriptional regulator
VSNSSILDLDSELDKLNKRRSVKIVTELGRGPHNITRIIEPYMIDGSDPKFRRMKRLIPTINKEKSIKVLTILKALPILKSVKKRKDDKVKTKKQMLTFKQTGSISLLALAAVVGITNILGLGVKEFVAAAVLCAMLFAYAIGE